MYLKAVVNFALGLQRLQLDRGGAYQRVASEEAAETAKPVASEAAGSTHKKHSTYGMLRVRLESANDQQKNYSRCLLKS